MSNTAKPKHWHFLSLSNSQQIAQNLTLTEGCWTRRVCTNVLLSVIIITISGAQKNPSEDVLHRPIVLHQSDKKALQSAVSAQKRQLHYIFARNINKIQVMQIYWLTGIIILAKYFVVLNHQEVIHFIQYKSFVDAAHQCHRQRVL